MMNYQNILCRLNSLKMKVTKTNTLIFLSVDVHICR